MSKHASKSSPFFSVQELLDNNFVPQEMRDQLLEYAEARSTFLGFFTTDDPLMALAATVRRAFEEYSGARRHALQQLREKTTFLQQEVIGTVERLLTRDREEHRQLSGMVEALPGLMEKAERSEGPHEFEAAMRCFADINQRLRTIAKRLA